jgi:DNA-cytosine methyltransferase
MNLKMADFSSRREHLLPNGTLHHPLLSARWTQVLLLEDNSARSHRRKTEGVRTRFDRDVVLRFHKIEVAGISIAAQCAYVPGTLAKLAGSGGIATVALELLDSIPTRPEKTLIVAGPRYGGNQWFMKELQDRGFNWIVELPRNAVVVTDIHSCGVPAIQLFTDARWKEYDVISPSTGNLITYAAAHLGRVPLSNGDKGRLFAAQTGAINGIHKGTIIGLSSFADAKLDGLLHAVGWARWIRPLVRMEERRLLKSPLTNGSSAVVKLPIELVARSNIALSRKSDELASLTENQEILPSDVFRGVLRSEQSALNVVELFAGGGGMGLGFVLADGRDKYRIGFSGEVHPIYAATLRANHAVFARGRKTPDSIPRETSPIDLRAKKSFEIVKDSMRHLGESHILIGGPPCQGFSSANRNSWHGSNPHNELVDVFLKYVRLLQPRVFLMENVQGILWTPKRGKATEQPSVVSSIAKRMERAGYLVFPKLLDAVWYGVPQYRSRFFLLGIHQDLGYGQTDFGSWGPFPYPTHGPGTPNPYVTVSDAIRDLPRIGNGHGIDEMTYIEPSEKDIKKNDYLGFVRSLSEGGVVCDHVTSRHADYVLDRYRQIPQGGNWEDITDSLTNYSDVKRTHSNIYRRLSWREPSITIGHYRKSMLVHPSQNRGLSLREAARLQSFPDWFRFLGTPNGDAGGLMHKQQQLANAVCPLVTKAIAEFLLKL